MAYRLLGRGVALFNGPRPTFNGTGFVISGNTIGWSDLEPNAPVGGVHTYNFTQIDNAFTYMTGQGLARGDLRIFTGIQAPDWMKTLVGSVTYSDAQGPQGTCADFWKQPYIDAWRLLQAAIAKRYGSDGRIASIGHALPMTLFAEPFTRAPASQNALYAAGLTDTADLAVHKASVDIHRDVWAQYGVRLRIALNPWMSSEPNAPQSVPRLSQVIDYAIQQLGYTGVILQNNSIRTPTLGGAYPELYSLMQSYRTQSIPIGFQTAGDGLIGNAKQTLQWAIDQGAHWCEPTPGVYSSTSPLYITPAEITSYNTALSNNAKIYDAPNITINLSGSGTLSAGAGVPAQTATAQLTGNGVLSAAGTSVIGDNLSNDGQGTVGQTLTTTNTSGPQQLDTVTISGVGTTITFDGAVSHSGGSSVKTHLPAGVAAAAWSSWKAQIIPTPVANGFTRQYMYLTAYPSPAERVASFLTATGTVCASVSINAAGTVRINNSTGTQIAVTTAIVPLNSLFRIEFDLTGISGTTGTVVVRIFSGVNLETNTFDTGGSLAVSNTGIGGLIGEVRYGSAATVTQTVAFDIWADDFAFSDTATPGPYRIAGSYAGAGALSSEGTLTVSIATPAVSVAPTLTGDGVLSAAASIVGRVDLTGSGSLSSGALVNFSGRVDLTGSGSLTSVTLFNTIGPTGTITVTPTVGSVIAGTTTVVPSVPPVAVTILTAIGTVFNASGFNPSLLSSTASSLSGGHATDILRAVRKNSATSNAVSSGKASILPFYPNGALDDFGFSDVDQPDPMISRVWNSLAALDSTAWQRVWLASLQPKDYYDGAGSLIWAHGAYAAVGFKWVGTVTNAVKYYDKVQFEHSAGSGNVFTNTLSPTNWQSTRVVGIVLGADRVNELTTPSFEAGQGTWAPFYAAGQAPPSVVIDSAVSRYGSNSLRLDIAAGSISRVANNGFETNAVGWTPFSGSIPGTSGIARSTAQAHSGAGSLAVSNQLVNNETTIGSKAILSTAIPAYQAMTVNVWVWPVLDPAQSQYAMQLQIRDDTHFTTLASQNYMPPGGQWSLLTLKTTVPANLNAESIFVSATGVGLANSAANQVLFYVDDVGVLRDLDTLGQGITLPQVLLRAEESYTGSASVRVSDPTVSVSMGLSPAVYGAHVYDTSPSTTGRTNLDGSIAYPANEGGWFRLWAKVLNSGGDNTADNFTVYTNTDPVTGNVPAFSMWIDGALIERSTKLLDYFDGGFLGVDYLWESAPYASRSHYYKDRREKQYRIDDVIQSTLPLGANYAVLYAQPDSYQPNLGGGTGGNSDGTYYPAYGMSY